MQIGSKDNGTENWNRVKLQFASIAPINDIYLHLQRNSNAWMGAVSFDGKSFFRIASTYSKTFTAGLIRLKFAQEEATIPMIGGIDWIRYNWLMLP